MLLETITLFCIKLTDAPQQNAETRILSLICVDALLCQGLKCVNRSLFDFSTPAENRFVDLASEILALYGSLSEDSPNKGKSQ
jgi:hypothetical protein